MRYVQRGGFWVALLGLVMLVGCGESPPDNPAATTAAPAATSPAGQDWRYAHEEFAGDVQDVFAQQFKAHIEANSPHRVQIFRFGELGESDDILEQAQAGILQFVNQSPGFTGALIPEAQVFFIPYLLPVDDAQIVEFFRTSKAIKEQFPALYAEQGLELLAMYPEGEMVVSADSPILTPEDFQGKNIRTMTNPLLLETYRAFGAIPTPLPWGDVYGGLQTNIIQGQENPIFWIESGGLYEVSPHLTFTGHGQFTTALMANQAFYQGLSDEDQQLIQQASAHAFDYIVQYLPGLGERMLQKILDSGAEVTVTRLNEEQRQRFRERATSVEDKFVELTGERGRALLEQFKQDLAAVLEE